MKIDYVITKDEPMRLIDFLTKHHYSKLMIKKMIQEKHSFIVNDRYVDINFLLLKDDHLIINLPLEKTFNGRVDELPNILYEDDYLMVIDKPPHLAVIGTRAHINYNLSLMIANYYQQKRINSGVHLINRLDKETSGLLMVAKHAYIHHLFSINVVTTTRKYIAIVEGTFKAKKGTINLPIKKHPNHTLKRIVDDLGKTAITHYKIIDSNNDFSVLELELETGRTHQIRVHFSHLNHPIVGDPLYGNEFFDKMFLQSYQLSFIHPIYNKEITITLPKEKQFSLKSLSLEDVYLPNTNFKLYQHKHLYHISSDTILLGEYLKINQDEVVVDVGTNNGALLLYASKYQPKLLIGVEINDKALNIARINLKKNKIENYQLINDAVQNVKLEDIDVIISNPPYYQNQVKLKNNSPNYTCTHEDTLTLSELFLFASNSLKNEGRFYLINRYNRLDEIKELCHKYHFEINDLWIEDKDDINKQRILLTLIKKST